MTDLVAFPSGRDPAGELVQWADAARAAHALATSLVRTKVVPQHFRDHPDEAAAAILLGSELGLSPVAALRSFYPTRDGALGLHAAMMLALVQSHGHRVWTVEASDDSVTVAGCRRDDPEHVESATWTMARAGRLGLLRPSRSGNPTSWETQPGNMLRNRAVTEVCRRIASDVLLGVPEVDDDGARPATGTRIVQRAPLAAPDRVRAETPVQDVELPPAPVEDQTPPAEDDGPDYAGDDDRLDPGDQDRNEDAEPLITEAQRARVMAGFNAMGIRGHDDRMRYIGALFAKTVGSTNDLTVTEASELIDALDRRLVP
jgi:hypothetical protein